jgi:hypothetical protein
VAGRGRCRHDQDCQGCHEGCHVSKSGSLRLSSSIYLFFFSKDASELEAMATKAATWKKHAALGPPAASTISTTAMSERDTRGRWRHGVSGNPAGRPKGSRNRWRRADAHCLVPQRLKWWPLISRLAERAEPQRLQDDATQTTAPLRCPKLGASMSKAEIANMVRQLRIIRYSPRQARMGRRAPSLRSIARASCVSHMTIYRIIRTGQISTKVAAALAVVLAES